MMQAQPKIVPAPLPDQNKIQLKLRRSQKSGLLGKPSFILDARADLTAEAKRLVSKCGRSFASTTSSTIARTSSLLGSCSPCP